MTYAVGTIQRDTINGVPCCVYVPGDMVKATAKTKKPEVKNKKPATKGKKTVVNAKQDKQEKYPVLYLHHGMVGSENDWPTSGNIVGIMDTLLRAGKIREMFIIMPDNCPSRSNWLEEKENATNGEWEKQFPQFMAESEAKYPISHEPSKCAIAGLSMGGYHTMRVATLLDGQFDYVAMFSPATFVHEAPTSPKVFMLAIGKTDFLYGSFKRYREWLDDHHKEYTYFESTGGHEWVNWQEYIRRFLPKLFLENER